MTKLIDRLARSLEGRLDRRGFLTRTAIGGAALTVAPVDFTLRPLKAYAAICNCVGSNCDCNSSCCDGYTEFCCTIYGSNRCPPGSVIAGWWKVDGSSFCGGSARYYMDCNAGCGTCGCDASGVCGGNCSNTSCGCALGDCNKRRSGCVQFRYGQCNQNIKCVGPILCRLVSCIPPWEIDASCTRTVAVDEATRNHTGPCLHSGRGSLDVVSLEQRTLRLQGWALDPDSAAPLQVRVLIDGNLANLGTADRRRDDIARFYPKAGADHGFDLTMTVTPGAHNIEVFGMTAYPGGDIVRLSGATVGAGPPFGSVDLVARAPGGIRVAGWMIDPNSDGTSNVHVYVDGKLVEIVPVNRERTDVTKLHPQFRGAHGYDGIVPAGGDGPHTVCVYAYNESQPANSPLLACRTITLRSSPVGSLDVVQRIPGGIRVAGWTFDPDTVGEIPIHVYIDGVFAASGMANRQRDDIAAAFPGYGAAHGFDLTFAAAGGRHDVCVYAINSGAGGNALVGCGSVVVATNPFGAVDLVARAGEQVRVAGWAVDPDTAGPIEVHVYADNVFVGSAIADRNRIDLVAAIPAFGPDHGFDITVRAPVARNVCVYAINVGGGGNPLLGCRAVL